ncbi:putative nima-interacting protein [Phaeoacremonium minimum UCRPA7]|uniref:Putative nima-interacting protein n=1 Tax=Phaeoacremonium minimum (strain UCR-PA7) TaxID=1286976 RepID=R8BGB5_PHAM7|nr:putative nima-interacting protein [Phaeoacremonium minimum UCRPA7]EON98353.1 putative nima-interacting protein [Phaeoacremonium minimum UCRPA7]
MSFFKPAPLLLGIALLFLLVKPAHAFGAGNIAGISKVEGQNWRHGDIEDTLLKILMARAVGGKKFDKMMVSRVYFGNWLRDYSQAIDVGTVKSVSAEAIRLLLCVLGFLSFGYGSREFEVTADRLGCYRPEDHIDNPKNYADNVDARQYDRRLRGPVDERVELAIDQETGMKNYIANERANIMTSALHVRRLFSKCIELARNYQRNRNKSDLYEALRLLGTGLHCLEDFLAHSNYTELALIELGERDVFPHVGSRTALQIRGARHEVYPLVTGTFGGVDFLHSVTGEVSDKLTQNEIQELEGTLEESQNKDTSILRDLLDKIPDGLFGGDDKKQKMDNIQHNASTAQMQQMKVSPREPEEYTQYVKSIFEQVMPAIEFHDDIIQSISEAIDKIPILPKIVEQLEEQLSVFVFSIIAPFIVPVINQVKNELRTGSDEIIESSKNEQHIVFDDDRSTDPTHSMLSKDHFSNILNEIAGQTASKVVGWVVPQLMQAWDDSNADVDRILNRIIYGVLHHPAQRDMGDDGAREGRQMMFRSVEEWWQNMGEDQKSDYRRKLSRNGVQRGENHKEGVYDTGHGHGCSGKLHMHKQFGGGENTLEDKIAGAAAGAIMEGVTGGISSIVSEQTGGSVSLPSYKKPQEEQKSGGFLGGVASLLGDAFKKDETETFQSRPQRQDDGGYSQTTTQYGHGQDTSGSRYGQAEYTKTDYDDGRQTTDYKRYEQDEDRRGHQSGGFGYEERHETRPAHGGGYEERVEKRWEGGGGNEYRREEETNSYGGGRRQEESYGGGRRQEESYGGGRREEESYGGGFGGGHHGGRREEESFGGGGGGFGGHRDGRREEEQSGWGERRDEGGFGGGFGGGRREEEQSGWGGGRREDEGFGGGRHGGRRDDNEGGGFGGGDGGDFVGNLVQEAAENAFGGGGGRRRDNDEGRGGGGWFS